MSQDCTRHDYHPLRSASLRSLLLATLMVLAGCASTPAPLADLERAEQSMAAARGVKAEEYAPVDWRLASQSFSQGQAEMGAKDYREATRLLRRAQVHADLARLRAENAQTRAQIEAQERENAKLRRELLGDYQ